jgi:hypothetical protein
MIRAVTLQEATHDPRSRDSGAERMIRVLAIQEQNA